MKTSLLIAVGALACATWASSASAKHHHKHTPAAPGVQAMGANAYPELVSHLEDFQR